jgi:DNA-binding transcriptional MerR regulator
MQVGEVATRAGVSVRSIRYYERAGLIAANRRTNGYREFDETAVELARAIRDLIAIGLTIDEVRSLSSCLPATTTTPGCCTQTVALYRQKLDQIDAQMRTLGLIRGQIEERLAALKPCGS